MDMLDRSDKPDIGSNKMWNNETNRVNIKVHAVRVVEDVPGVIQRRVAKMNNQVYHLEKSGCKVTGSITGITTDNNKKAGILQCRSDSGCVTFQSFRKLEGNSGCP